MPNQTMPQSSGAGKAELNAFLRYFGYLLLFFVPVIGWIAAIAFACGATKRRELRSLARGYLAALVIMLIIGAVAFNFAMSAVRYTFSLVMEFVDSWTDYGVSEIGGGLGDALLKADFDKLYEFYKSGDLNLDWSWAMALTFSSDMRAEDDLYDPDEHVIGVDEMQQMIDEAQGRNTAAETTEAAVTPDASETSAPEADTSAPVTDGNVTQQSAVVTQPPVSEVTSAPETTAPNIVLGAGTSTDFKPADLEFTGLDVVYFNDIILQLVEMNDLDSLTPQAVKAIDYDMLGELIDSILALSAQKPSLLSYFDLDSLRRLERIASRYN